MAGKSCKDHNDRETDV